MLDPHEVMIRAEIIGTQELIEDRYAPPDDMFMEDMYDH